MRAFLEARGNLATKDAGALERREQTVAELLSQGKELPSIEIHDENIKSFDSIARKYGIDYEIRQDKSGEQSTWLVFFRPKDIDDLKAAFDEFSSRALDKTAEKPSLRQTMQRMMEKVKNQILHQDKHRERGRER